MNRRDVQPLIEETRLLKWIQKYRIKIALSGKSLVIKDSRFQPEKTIFIHHLQYTFSTTFCGYPRKAEGEVT